MARLDPKELQKRLKRALDVMGNTHTPEDIARLAAEGRLQVWQNGDSMAITEIVIFPQLTYLNVFTIVGHTDEVMAMLPDVVAFAKAHGCTKIVSVGRKGWERVLPKWGFKPIPRAIMELEL